ncbi:hypothetical protein AMJ40_01165 [candidate division TA06 bacterium DG_26]|uniref:Uncharacterized protein n=1 Tax=candidate division TA06 bacterium DG_26 TaxID=1703771 RepID=A0A0S7WLR7_UNCT6|nr:MAG: hypothetical protein AMJ40_01165 [candidate division TA06 bacterium DG_26]
MDPGTLRRVTREFNRYRAPECRARTVRNGEDRLVVEFSGTAAHFACCFDEHFVDYGYYLKDVAESDFEIEKIERMKNGWFAVTYRRAR